MSVLSRYVKIAAVAVGVLGGASLYYVNRRFEEAKHVAFASWTTNYSPSAHSKWDDNWDHRSFEASVHPKKRAVEDKDKDGGDGDEVSKYVEAKRPTATRHLILIRHGQYNLDGITDADRYLTKLGRSQAECTGNRLRELCFPYTEMIQSTMARAQETGGIIAKFLPAVPVRECNLIREGAPVPPEPPMGHWRPEVHQFYEDGARIEAAFRRYFHRADVKQDKDSYTILVCHANVIRYFVCRALQFPAEAWLRLSLHHASVTWISITPSGRVILRVMGDVGHMPPELLTSR